MTGQRLRLLTILLFGLLAATAAATNFVSYNGKFYISYPETWKQMDYLTVDAFLTQAGGGRMVMEYEAAFAPQGSEPWHKDAYLILAVDTIPGIGARQIDSILRSVEEGLGKPRQQRTFANLLTDLPEGQLVWDPETKSAAAVVHAAASGPREKTSLLVLRFYDNGIANFYFYASQATYRENLEVFKAVLSSFSTDNPETAALQEPHKVASADRVHQIESASDSNLGIWVPAAGVLVALLAIALIVSRRRKQTRANQ